MQTKKLSLIESITSTLIGFTVSLLVQIVIYPIMNIPETNNSYKNCVLKYYVLLLLNAKIDYTR